MTPADLSRLETLAREATPGEWTAAREGNTYWTVMIRGDTPLVRYANECDAAYIAAANPAAVLALIELLAQCKATLEAPHPGAGLPDSDVARLYNAMMEKLT